MTIAAYHYRKLSLQSMDVAQDAFIQCAHIAARIQIAIIWLCLARQTSKWSPWETKAESIETSP